MTGNAFAKIVEKGSFAGYIVVMAKEPQRKSTDGEWIVIKGSDRRQKKTRLGNVTVVGKSPSAAIVEVNIDRSTKALERVGKKLVKPGFRVTDRKGVPRFSVDEERPGYIIRRLDGKISIGRLQNGKFVEVE